MAIVTVKAMTYSSMKDYLAGNPVNSAAVLANRHDKVWIISITNGSDRKTPILITQETEDRIALQFDDEEPKSDSYSGLEHYDPRYVYFDEAMARKICGFVKRAHENNPEGRDLLLVNCHMGVARSGAVADFARTVCRIPWDEFKRMNPGINPNLLVKGLLRAIWTEMEGKQPGEIR